MVWKTVAVLEWVITKIQWKILRKVMVLWPLTSDKSLPLTSSNSKTTDLFMIVILK